MDYNSGYDYPTVDTFIELGKLQAQNKTLSKLFSIEKGRIDNLVAHGEIDTVTAFMKYKTLEAKADKMRKLLNLV